MNQVKTTKLSIVLPCYNEADNIKPLLGRFKEVVDRDDVEVIIVDNGSTDGTGEQLSRLLPEHPFAKSIRIEQNQGYGSGIIAGLRTASGRYLGWTHADMQTDPLDVIKALRLIEDRDGPENIYIKGLRKGRPPADSLFTLGMSAFETLFLGVPLWDVNAQPNIFPRAFFDTWNNPPRDFSLDLYALFTARKQGVNIVRFPVNFTPRERGESKWNTGFSSRIKMIKRTAAFSVALKRDLNNGIRSAQD